MQIKNNKYFKDGCNLENFSKLKKSLKLILRILMLKIYSKIQQ